MRLLTRSDFDGLGCAVLLKEAGIIDDIKFVHPKDVQDGKVDVTPDDVLANIPYVKGCGLWFDHHSSEEERKLFGEFEGDCDTTCPSAARVIYDYYGGRVKFNDDHFETLISAVDKADSANFSFNDILNPSGWSLVSFVMDPRTGLGRYKTFRISNYQLMMDMIDYCRSKTIDEILEIDDVKERTNIYFKYDEDFRKMIKSNTVIAGNVIVLDLRNQDEIYPGNRFIHYCFYPKQNISIQVIWGLRKQNIVITCGHSVLNRSSNVDTGSLMLKYGGGGHKEVGTCQVPIDKADSILEELIEVMNNN